MHDHTVLSNSVLPCPSIYTFSPIHCILYIIIISVSLFHLPLSPPRSHTPITPQINHQPPYYPQIPLHLPFESRSLREQKDLLGFEDVAESFITPQERKDAKRSDPGSSDKNRFDNSNISNSNSNHRTTESRRSSSSSSNSNNSNNKNSTSTASKKNSNVTPRPEKVEVIDDGYVDDEEEVGQDGRENLDGIDEEEEEVEVDNARHGQGQNNPQSKDNAASHNLKKYSTTYSDQPQKQPQQRQAQPPQQKQEENQKKATQSSGDSGSSSSSSSSSSNSKAPKSKQSYDKTLLIPQERYKSTLPKIIITASASVSANGKKLNYSLGNVLGQGAELKIPPPTYDDYKEEDVVLDPFFQDVPKISKKH